MERVSMDTETAWQALSVLNQITQEEIEGEADRNILFGLAQASQLLLQQICPGHQNQAGGSRCGL